MPSLHLKVIRYPIMTMIGYFLNLFPLNYREYRPTEQDNRLNWSNFTIDPDKIENREEIK